MELKVTQQNLAKALNIVSKIANIKTQMPILDNILLKTEDNRLLIASTNLEIAITQYIGAKITKPGSITIPARIMTEFVNSLPADVIDLKVDGTHLKINSGKFSSTINGIEADEFPDLPTIDEENAIHLNFDVDLFKQSIAQTLISTSSDISRPVLTGVLWKTFDNNLYFASTDGYRLSEKKIMPLEQEIEIVIPTQTLQEVIRSIDDQSKEIEVIFNESQVRFMIGDTEIISQLLDGTFPDYRRLIPQQNEIRVIANKSEFSKVVKISSYFTQHTSNGVIISADLDNQNMIFKSVASEIGENSSEIAAEVAGDSGTISLNAKYLTDALAVMNGNEINFDFNGKIAPCIIRPKDQDDYLHIIMPLKS